MSLPPKFHVSAGSVKETGMDAYHTFLFAQRNLRVVGVVTEEVVRGPGAAEFRQEGP